MSGNRQYCFTHSSGEDIYLFTLRNTKGTEVLVTNYGAILTAFKLPQPDGSFHDIVLGFDKVEDYLQDDYLRQYPWFGCAVGRYANRIGNSSFSIDGRQYQLAANKDPDHLHGGMEGFDKKVWKVDSFIQSPRPALTMGYKSVDGEEGYPGNLEVKIQFELSDKDELSYEYYAVCDKATAVNLTHHSYFNLDNGAGTIRDHHVKIYASHTLGQGDNLVVKGTIIPVTGSAYDFREFCTIGEGLKKTDEYDKSFVVDRKNGLDKSAELSLVAEALSLRSNIQLRVYSTEPIVHFYSGKWISAFTGKEGKNYGPFSGFCLETHKHPNAINIPHFPDTVLRPGQKYYQKTVYHITQIAEK